jgi:FtsP/CotA-like multicopper oxidase with cupredoxin domain
MSYANSKNWCALYRFLSVVALALLLAAAANAAAPGITASGGGTSTFNLNAGPGYSSQPDGVSVYSWGYGCTVVNSATYAPAQFAGIGFCPSMQLPGPTLIVTEGQTFTVTLTNSLPGPAGNTSILFPGAKVLHISGVAGLLTHEAPSSACNPTSNPGCNTVTYSVTYTHPGTFEYYSGTQPDLQIEMGLFGAVVVRPAIPFGLGNSSTTPNCMASWQSYREDYRLASSAYNTPLTCYDREYLFQWSEMDPKIHKQAEDQVNFIKSCAPGGQFSCPTTLNVVTEPYHPNYFLINGRSMPDNMDPDYAPNYPNQPYNANPHMHPGELVLVRYMGQGHWQHPFHEHGNHVHIFGRDGNLLLAQANNPTGQTLLAGRMEFNTDTTPGQADEGVFYWSGKGLGWDILGHTAANGVTNPPCYPDVNGYYTQFSSPPASIPTYVGGVLTPTSSPNFYEWCADHNHPLEANPIGQVGGGGPATLPDPLIVTNGLWYNGTPYLSHDAVVRARGTAPLPPGSAGQNPPLESGIAFMWHSHNEREITTNDVFPGGMLMMMLVDPYAWNIDETL